VNGLLSIPELAKRSKPLTEWQSLVLFFEELEHIDG
jgi:hypothetical protein